MVFSSMTFLVLFLPLLLALYFPVKNINWRNAILLIFSILFYSWGEPVWISIMLLSTAVNYVCALIIERSQKKSIRITALTIGAILSLIFLVYFKYAAFIVNSVTDLFNIQFTMSSPELPIGISFYTFQILTYTVDVYRNKAAAQKNPLLLLLYVCCFPQLIAGPIVQYADVAEMLKNRTSTVEGFSSGMRRFVIGLSKKVILANICGAILNELPLAAAGVSLSVAGAWYSAVIYSFQLYFDFSAYSDMAIGLGSVFGFDYKENFNYPYISSSISEFWRRWHISLGSFFREYVYIPLGGNRVSKSRNAFNLLVVWSLTGLWHGASWNFLAWGAYYGILIMAERFIIGKKADRLPYIIRLIPTLLLTVVGWVIFYYTDFSLVAQHLAAMFGFDISVNGNAASAALTDPVTMAVIRKYTILPIIAAVCSTPIVPVIRKKIGNSPVVEIITYIAVSILLILSVIFLIGQTYNPFIYFRF